MIINKANIKLFRGFKNVEFSLGEYITLIAGQNGTQKSTLLGILTQTFTIPNQGHPFSDEIPLTGGSFRSAFQDKFRLSPTRDIAGTHEWTLYFKDNNLHPDIDDDGRFTVESIPRKNKDKESIRFWQKGNRSAGSGYVQLPVIYLSLKRLIPIAEAGLIKEKDIQLTDKEKKWFSLQYNQILLSNDELESVDYLESSNKNTMGVTTNYYDWNSNSAGQDNLGRILLAIISFQRLQNKYHSEYKGGILAIDEIDATLYPASQVKLLEVLSSACKKFKIQMISTTHSLHLLEKIIELKGMQQRTEQFNTLYLKKVDDDVHIEENPSFERMTYNLNVSLDNKKIKHKVYVYTEDNECIHFAKALLGRRFKNLDFPRVPLGCNNLIQLGKVKVAAFSYPNSITILDGDAQLQLKNSKLKNYICLPGDYSPECMLAKFLNSLSDTDIFWENRVQGYNKQYCFKEYKLSDIISDREKAKKWYNLQLETSAWGRDGSAVYRLLIKSFSNNEKEKFIEKFNSIYKDCTEKSNVIYI